MKVLCIENEIDDNLALEVGLLDGEPRLYRSVTRGKEYVVLGFSYDPSSTCYARKPVIEIQNDGGGLSLMPLFLFDIVDNRASKYWQCKFSSDGILTFLPESFYGEYYHNDLSEGIPEVVNDFREIYTLFENEVYEKQ